MAELTDELAREARLVAVEWAGAPDADALANAAGAALGHRVTLIRDDGVVIGDSEFDGPALARLENHRNRPEIAAARTVGQGSSRRRSPSRGDVELYVAVRAPLGVARVSIGTSRVEALVARAQRDVLSAGAIALLVAVALAATFARALSRPIIELRDEARALAAGDLTRRPRISAPGEVGDLAAALADMADQLGARLRAIQADEAQMVAVLESLEEGVVAVDARRNVVRVNASARRLLGVPSPVPFPADHLPRDARLREALLSALAGEPASAGELRIGDRTLAVAARPLQGRGAVLAVVDLTAVRRLETVRRDFVANVSHELKTPLTVIGGFAETLAEDDPPADDRKRFAAAIRANATRMQRIVDDLLDLSRIESGGWVPNPQWLDVAASAAEAALPLREAATRKGVSLEVAPHGDARVVYADPTALLQVLGNLLDNAIRHTTAGAVTVFSEPAAGGAWVGVRDTGSGIAAEHLPRIFERFYRADPGRSREQGGTGLGLAIVKHLVEAHGGRVRAESTPGHGTAIAAFFPAPGVARAGAS